MESYEAADVCGATLVGLFIWVRYVLRVKGRSQTAGPYHRRFVAGWIGGDRYVMTTPQEDLYDEDLSDDTCIGHAIISDLDGDKFYHIPDELQVLGFHDWESKPSAARRAELLKEAAKEVKKIRNEEKISQVRRPGFSLPEEPSYVLEAVVSEEAEADEASEEEDPKPKKVARWTRHTGPEQRTQWNPKRQVYETRMGDGVAISPDAGALNNFTLKETEEPNNLAQMEAPTREWGSSSKYRG